MASFNFSSTAKKKRIDITNFLGVDFTTNPENTDMRRSNDAPNIIRDTVGKNKKRFGYVAEYAFLGEINGIHTLNYKGEEKMLVHAGTELYLKNGDEYNSIFSDMNDARSTSAVLAGKLVILDGKTMISFDGENITNIRENAYVPTIIIGRHPSGGGILYEPINMISDYRIERFTADGVSKEFYTSSGIYEEIKYVKLRELNGTWKVLIHAQDYTYNIVDGHIKFYEAPPVMEDGEDSVEVCYRKTNEEYSEIINSCNICTLYGVNGSLDRIFIAGSTKYPNRDYYCQFEDPTYWGDVWYGSIGRSDNPIIGYSLVSNYLATHKANEDSNANIILRKGAIIDNEPCFPITGTYHSSGAVSPYSFSTLDNEPVYLSEDGISAITPSDVLGERFSQVRSYFLNGRLLREENLKNASAVTYKDFYMLLVNNNIYILDGLQSVYSKNEPFSQRQYEAYFWNNIQGKFLFTDRKTLYLAGYDGILYRFSEDVTTDNGTPVSAYWDTPSYLGDDFSKMKTFTYISVLLDSPTLGTTVEYKKEDGDWEKIAEETEANNGKVIGKRIHLKNSKSAKFRIKNDKESDFEILRIQLFYTNGKKTR